MWSITQRISFSLTAIFNVVFLSDTLTVGSAGLQRQ
jgi:hypothetical protein